jgi:hypothetical protein
MPLQVNPVISPVVAAQIDWIGLCGRPNEEPDGMRATPV